MTNYYFPTSDVSSSSHPMKNEDERWGGKRPRWNDEVGRWGKYM